MAYTYRITAWPKDAEKPIVTEVTSEVALEAVGGGEEVNVSGLSEITRLAELPNGEYREIHVEYVNGGPGRLSIKCGDVNDAQ